MCIAGEVFSQGQNCWENVNTRTSISQTDIYDSQNIVVLLINELVQILLVVDVCDELASLDSICCMVRIVQDA